MAPDTMIHIRLTADEKKRLAVLCAMRDQTMQEVVRDLVITYVDKQFDKEMGKMPKGD